MFVIPNPHGFIFWRKLTEAANSQIVYLIEKKQNTRTLSLPFNKKPRTFCFFRLEVLMSTESEIMEEEGFQRQRSVVDTNRIHTYFSKKHCRCRQ